MLAAQYNVRSRIVDEIYTYCAFCVAASTLPVLAVSYVGKYSHRISFRIDFTSNINNISNYYSLIKFNKFILKLGTLDIRKKEPKETGRENNISSLYKTFTYFAVVRASKYLWLKLLSSRYPDFEFIRTDTIRSLLDTHRNQGIINVLLSIQGT